MTNSLQIIRPKLYLLAFFMGCLSILSGQNHRVINFDANWNETSNNNSPYYRIVYLNSNGDFTGSIKDFYRDGRIQSALEADYYILNCGKWPLDCGVQNGEIRFYHANGEVSKFVRFANNKPIGIVELTAEGEAINYAGCIDGDCTTGYGTFITSDHDMYKGAFRSGLFHGEGTYTWANGKEYTGQFSNGKIASSTSEYTMKDVVNTLEAGYWLYKIYKEFSN